MLHRLLKLSALVLIAGSALGQKGPDGKIDVMKDNIELIIAGKSHELRIEQTGSRNAISVKQSDGKAVLDVAGTKAVVRSGNNSIEYNQIGDSITTIRNNAVIRQTGSGNKVVIKQTGGGNSSTINQSPLPDRND